MMMKEIIPNLLLAESYKIKNFESKFKVIEGGKSQKAKKRRQLLKKLLFIFLYSIYVFMISSILFVYVRIALKY